MTKRLQVVLQDAEYREIQHAAQARHMSLAEWVQQALELALRDETASDVGRKLDAIRTAARHNFPSGNIESVLAEMESGFGSESDS